MPPALRAPSVRRHAGAAAVAVAAAVPVLTLPPALTGAVGLLLSVTCPPAAAYLASPGFGNLFWLTALLTASGYIPGVLFALFVSTRGIIGITALNATLALFSRFLSLAYCFVFPPVGVLLRAGVGPYLWVSGVVEGVAAAVCHPTVSGHLPAGLPDPQAIAATCHTANFVLALLVWLGRAPTPPGAAKFGVPLSVICPPAGTYFAEQDFSLTFWASTLLTGLFCASVHVHGVLRETPLLYIPGVLFALAVNLSGPGVKLAVERLAPLLRFVYCFACPPVGILLSAGPGAPFWGSMCIATLTVPPRVNAALGNPVPQVDEVAASLLDPDVMLACYAVCVFLALLSLTGKVKG